MPHKVFQLGLVSLVEVRDSFNCRSCWDLCNLRNELHSVVVVTECQARLLVFVTRCCVSWHGYLFFWFSSNRCSVL